VRSAKPVPTLAPRSSWKDEGLGGANMGQVCANGAVFHRRRDLCAQTVGCTLPIGLNHGSALAQHSPPAARRTCYQLALGFGGVTRFRLFTFPAISAHNQKNLKATVN